MTPRKAAPPYTLSVTKCHPGHAAVLITEAYRRNAWTEPTIRYLEVSQDGEGIDQDRRNYRVLSNPTDTLARWVGREDAATYYATEEAVTAAETLLNKTIAKREADIRKGRRTWQYKAIASWAEALGWPASFQTDMTRHDALILQTTKPAVFLWSLRESGTWMYLNDLTIESRRHDVDQNGDRTRYFVVTEKLGATEIKPAAFRAYRFSK